MICNVADLIAADLSPYFFFVFWTAEYAKKRQGAAALFAPKEKESPLSPPPFNLSSPLLSKMLQDKSLCKSAEEESDDGHEKNGPFYHPLSKATAQGIVSRGTPRRLLPPPMQCSGGRVPVGDEQDTERRNAGLGIQFTI